MSTKKIAASLLALAALALIPASSAQAAAPEWNLSLSAFPHSFIAGASGNPTDGPGLHLVAKNVGNAPTSGTYSLIATLPEELSPGAGISGKDQKGNPLTCEASGQTVTCTGTIAIGPGEFTEATIPVDVAADAIGKRAHSEARVEGGGAGTVSKATDNGIGIPGWQITGTALPTNFAPGSTKNEILMNATNVGAATTSGPITFTDTLPDGLTPTSAAGIGGLCEISGQTVTCSGAPSVAPGKQMEIKIKVDADFTLASSPNKAVIEGGGAPPSSTEIMTTVSSATAPFGFLSGASGVAAPLTGPDGGPVTQAGSHPYQLTVNLGLPTEKPDSNLGAAGHVRDLGADLPRGMIANPNATPVLCTEAQLISSGNPGCPAASQIGTASPLTVGAVSGIFTSPLYNMVTPRGVASNFGFDALGVGLFSHIIGGVRSDGDYGLSGTSYNVPALTFHPIFGVRLDLWGDPTSPSHDEVRDKCLFVLVPAVCPTPPSDTAFLTAPSECTGQPTTTGAFADSWEEPGVIRRGSYQSADLEGNPVAIDGCNQLEFKPSIEARPTTNVADAPTGLDVDVHQPQNMDVDGLSPAIMKDITLTLPEGMAINPSSADGLGVCTEEQSNVHSKEPAECPDSAKVGTVEVTTPLLDHSLPGALYVAKPFDNPLGSLVAVYLAVHDPKSGVVANIAGKVNTDPASGQLRTVFTDNPQLPIEDIRVHLFTGPRAPLRTPSTCGTHTSSADITPWSAPETPVAHPSDSFAIQVAPGGGDCPSSGSAAANSFAFSAGTIAPQAGAFSPFVLKVSREDASQNLAGIEATLPPGLSGKLAGIGTCSDAQLAVASARSHPNEGALERQSPSCPASSEVGVVDVTAGAGITPLHAEGHAYLAGPYKGAPISLAIVTPAVAGPFDLGAVLVRTALYVDPVTAKIHAVSDPLPQILEGIPLDVRSVSLRMGRPSFTLNPTSCDPMAITGSATTALGQLAALKSPFQVGGCPALPFKPKLALALKGGTKRADHPKLIATLNAKAGEANTASASVTLPKSAFLDQAHIRTVCTRVQFAANACPPGSIYGKATAITPLLDYPLSGNVYLRSSNNKLPDLVVALRGPASQPIEIDLAGRTDSVKGALRNTFDVVPDAPVSSFKLELLGGKRGLVVNSRNLCAQTYRATVVLVGQNGKAYDTTPAVGTDCKGKSHRKGKGKKGR